MGPARRFAAFAVVLLVTLFGGSGAYAAGPFGARSATATPATFAAATRATQVQRALQARVQHGGGGGEIVPMRPVGVAVDHPPLPLASPRAQQLTRLGIPQISKVEDPHALVLPRQEFVALYYPDHKIPKLVSWVTTPRDVEGHYARHNAWHPDPYYDGPKAMPQDYQGLLDKTGFNRGHMVRSGERVDAQANRELFSFLNILPQAIKNNGGPWLHLENHYKDAVESGKFDAHVQAGAILEGKPQVVGDGVTVPTATWKVVLLTPTGSDPRKLTVQDVQSGRARMYAVIVPNDNSKISTDDPFTRYAVPLAEIERRGNFQGLLSGLQPDVRQALFAVQPQVKMLGGRVTSLNGERIEPNDQEGHSPAWKAVQQARPRN